MASKDPRMSKQGTADKKQEATLMIQQKVEIIMRTECGKNKERLWFQTEVDCQLSMIQRNGRTNYDHL
jgi:hypothetical protein